MENCITLDNLPAKAAPENIIDRYIARINIWRDSMAEQTARWYQDKCERNIALLEHEREIMLNINNIGKSYLQIGLHLSEIQEQDFSGGMQDADNNVMYYTFEDYVRGRFGLSRTSAYTLINVYKTYTYQTTGELFPEYQNYSYSQLVEMLPLDSAERSTISPAMTVKEIREYRKRLELQGSPAPAPPPVIEAPVIVTAPEQIETIIVEPVPTSGQPEPASERSPGITYWANEVQRRAWLDTYRDWPLWLSVPQLKLDVYRVELTDGYTILAYEYTARRQDGVWDEHRSVNYMLFAPGEEIVLDYYTTAPTYIVQHITKARAGAYWTEVTA